MNEARQTTALTVRPVMAADHPAWLRLWEGYNAFYGRAGPTALEPAIIESTWRRFLDPLEPMHALVAERGGELVGLAHFIFHRNTILLGDTCYLQDLFTAEAARGAGIGRALIEETALRARAAGCARLYWHTHETNAAAMKLYDQVARKSGFVVYRKDL
ncbi:MAG TPA: GNAT family N-acetyltransferase [Myxococcales bacterium]